MWNLKFVSSQTTPWSIKPSRSPMIASGYNKISLIWKSRNRIGRWSSILQNVTFYTSQFRKCHPHVHIYKLKGQVLDPLHSAKKLGVYLSVDLRWNDHIKTISNKANKTLGFLKRNLILCPPKTNETAYKTLGRPNSGILFICVEFTGSCDRRFFHFRTTLRAKRELYSGFELWKLSSRLGKLYQLKCQLARMQEPSPLWAPGPNH